MKFIKTLLFCTISLFSNAQNWIPVGGGINIGSAELFSYEDKLFAGGSFTNIDGVTSRGIACWNGKKWKSFVLDGLSYFQTNSFATYNNELYAYGSTPSSLGISSIIKYNKITDTWADLPNSMVNEDPLSAFENRPGLVTSIVEFQDELYICGYFRSVSDKDVKNIAKWNGNEWKPILNYSNNEFQAYYILTAEVFNNKLIISGPANFNINNHNYSLIASWDGEAWSSLSGELLDDNYDGFYQAEVFDLQVFQGELYAAGTDISVSNTEQTYSLVKWDGNQWEGINGFESGDLQLTTIKPFGNFLAIGGWQENIAGNDRQGITFLYNGLTTTKIEGAPSGTIRSFAEYNKQLFTGTYISPTTISNDIGIHRLGNINTTEETNPTCNFFPNPTDGEFMINYKTLENTSTIIRFHTLSGVLVYEEIFNDLKGDYLRRFNLEDFTSGIYVVHIQSKGINESKIIMKN